MIIHVFSSSAGLVECFERISLASISHLSSKMKARFGLILLKTPPRENRPKNLEHRSCRGPIGKLCLQSGILTERCFGDPASPGDEVNFSTE